MKRILLIGYNYSPEPTGIGKYTGEMIIWLAQHGYQCTVITAYPYYPHWKVQEPYNKNRFWYKKEKQEFSEGGGKINVHRCPMFVPEKPSGLKRILLDFSFTVTALLKLIQLLPGKRFDMVVTIVPSFQFGLLGILYKKLFKAKLLYHIHDMQIEAARDLKMIKSEKLINMLFRMEKFIFRQCDVITCTGEGMVRKTKEKIKRDIFFFSNWADIRNFKRLKNRESLKTEFGFALSNKILLYSGAIGEKQGLESLLYTAKSLEENPDLKFLICGSGPYKETLQELAESLQLQNVLFYPLQPVEKFNLFLNMADVHLVIQKESACDLVMPSKLATILSVGGLALVTANSGSGLHSVVKEHRMGILVNAEDQQALAEGIKTSISQNHEEIRRNARHYAEDYLAIDRIMGAFEEDYMLPAEIRKVKIKTKPVTTAPQTHPVFMQDRAAMGRVIEPSKKPQPQKLKKDRP